MQDAPRRRENTIRIFYLPAFLAILPSDMDPATNSRQKMDWHKSRTLARLRLVAILEGISFLALLFVAMPLKYWYQDPYWVQKIGMVHGWLFVLYVVLLVLAHFQYKWSFGKTTLGFVLSLLPFGTFYAERKLFIDDKL